MKLFTPTAVVATLLAVAGCASQMPASQDVSLGPALTDQTAASAACPALFGDPNQVGKQVLGLDDEALTWRAQPLRDVLSCDLVQFGKDDTGELQLSVSSEVASSNTQIAGAHGSVQFTRPTGSLTAEQAKNVQAWLTQAASHIQP